MTVARVKVRTLRPHIGSEGFKDEGDEYYRDPDDAADLIAAGTVAAVEKDAPAPRQKPAGRKADQSQG